MSVGRMIAHVVGLVWVAALVAVILYASRFWVWAFWTRDGLFGQTWLSPGGDLLRQQLRGLGIANYDIAVWGGGAIVLLSVLAWVIGRISPSS